MRDSPPERQSAPVEDVADAPKPSYEDMERERLINDIAFIVVRQHQYSQPITHTDPSSAAANSVAD